MIVFFGQRVRGKNSDPRVSDAKWEMEWPSLGAWYEFQGREWEVKHSSRVFGKLSSLMAIQ